MGISLLSFVWQPSAALMPTPGTLVTIAPSLAAVTILAWFLLSSHRARERLRHEIRHVAESELHHRAIIEASPNCIQTLDAHGHCLSVNALGLVILGLHQNQVLGQSMFSHWPAVMQPALSAAFERALRGQMTHLDTIYRRPDGEERVLNVTFNPSLRRQGVIENVICMAIDLTDRKRVELEAYNAKHAAEAATRAKSDFLAIVSHEIRTPLGGVIGMLELLAKQPQNALQQRYTTLAHENAHSLVELLNDLLDHSKASAGKLALEAIPFRPRLELSRAIECHKTRALAKGLAYNAKVADDVPEFLQGDPTRLRQAVGNLLNNAIKFTSKGSVEIEVSNAVPRSGGRALSIRISDTGPGIPVEAQSRLFTDFEQADSSTSRFFGGSGLGLAIVKQIAELMRGDVTVTSQTGQGTTFLFTAEFDVPTPDVIEAISVHTRPPSIPQPTHRLRVLCADDEPINRTIAEGFVRGFGHDIDFANDGEDAIAKLTEKDFDVVLMDSRMPRLNGVDATQRIRSKTTAVRDHGVFIAATTADTSSSHREKCFSVGMNRFLVKPFHEVDLALLLQEVISCQLARGRTLPEMADLPPKFTSDPDPAVAKEAPSGMSEGDLLAILDSAEASQAASPVPASAPKPEIVLRYLCDAPARFAQMRTALRDRDVTALGIAAHSIKSISFYVSAHTLCVLGRKIESAADAGRLEEAEALLEEAETAFTEVRKQLTRTPHEALVS
jgi:PAS domain S-box-containing protein